MLNADASVIVLLESEWSLYVSTHPGLQLNSIVSWVFDQQKLKLKETVISRSQNDTYLHQSSTTSPLNLHLACLPIHMTPSVSRVTPCPDRPTLTPASALHVWKWNVFTGKFGIRGPRQDFHSISQ